MEDLFRSRLTSQNVRVSFMVKVDRQDECLGLLFMHLAYHAGVGCTVWWSAVHFGERGNQCTRPTVPVAFGNELLNASNGAVVNAECHASHREHAFDRLTSPPGMVTGNGDSSSFQF